MDKAKRKAIIAGNWKMNKTASEAAVLVDELIPAVKDAFIRSVDLDGGRMEVKVWEGL